MRLNVLAAVTALVCAGCVDNGVPLTRTPGAVTNMTPNGDVVRRTDTAAPDTPPGTRPARNYKDNAVDTDPSSPRYRDRGQQVEVPLLSQ